MNSFEDLSLEPSLVQALEKLNFQKPTPVQKLVIPKLMTHQKDMIASAETGSGKTAAYSIPIVQKLIENPNSKALILAPTRELAQQIGDFIRELTHFTKNLPITSLVGGSDIRKQFKALKRSQRLIIATPGRLIDHIKRQSVQLDEVKFLVLDEGDRMIDMGFAPQLNEIQKKLPQERQSLMFSATLPVKVEQLAKKYLNKPERVSVGEASLPAKNIKQSIVEVHFKEKDDRIIDELNQREGSVIIFARTKHRTDRLAHHLHSFGFAVDKIHGGLTQGQRNKSLRNFKSGKSRILCATDVAARGIDVPQVAHVINFDLPTMQEDYVHRIGRTARNEAEGEAVSFVMPEESGLWLKIAREYKILGVELTNKKAGKLKSKSRFKSSGRSGGRSGYGSSERRPSKGRFSKTKGRSNRFSEKFGEDSSSSRSKKSEFNFEDEFGSSRSKKPRNGRNSFSKKGASSRNDFESNREERSQSFSKSPGKSKEKWDQEERRSRKKGASNFRGREDSPRKGYSSRSSDETRGPRKNGPSQKKNFSRDSETSGEESFRSKAKSRKSTASKGNFRSKSSSKTSGKKVNSSSDRKRSGFGPARAKKSFKKSSGPKRNRV